MDDLVVKCMYVCTMVNCDPVFRHESVLVVFTCAVTNGLFLRWPVEASCQWPLADAIPPSHHPIIPPPRHPTTP